MASTATFRIRHMRTTLSIAMLIWSAANATQASPLGLTHQPGIEVGQDLVSTVAQRGPVEPRTRWWGRGHAGPAKATIQMQCGKVVVSGGTGNDHGTCTHTGTGPKGSITCDDRNGNSATASCAGGCLQTTGSGSCTILKS
jgi:hypothetical protein